MSSNFLHQKKRIVVFKNKKYNFALFSTSAPLSNNLRFFIKISIKTSQYLLIIRTSMDVCSGPSLLSHTVYLIWKTSEQPHAGCSWALGSQWRTCPQYATTGSITRTPRCGGIPWLYLTKGHIAQSCPENVWRDVLIISPLRPQKPHSGGRHLKVRLGVMSLLTDGGWWIAVDNCGHHLAFPSGGMLSRRVFCGGISGNCPPGTHWARLCRLLWRLHVWCGNAIAACPAWGSAQRYPEAGPASMDAGPASEQRWHFPIGIPLSPTPP